MKNFGAALAIVGIIVMPALAGSARTLAPDVPLLKSEGIHRN